METACPLVFSNPILLRSSGKLHVHTHTHTHTSTTHSPQKSEGILIRYVDGSLFQRARRQDFQRLDMDVDTPRGETHTWGTVRLAPRSIFVQKCTKRGGTASIQYWRWRGQASQGVPGAEEQSSKGLNPETSHPAASSACANSGGGRFGTCCGQFCPQRPG